ncbi:hypothetical protein GQ55_4G190400 [Panicum hallii var. hallii]|uniref:Large ribosomal subunit protein bL20c n=1 Tax=Panicum hallii var. hallii TaxID=1504633 RepID=A0A2T7DYZ4_9POAL|nr:hypothetical protein GQ55_4G190400 [Panicum hallii var. hallii]
MTRVPRGYIARRRRTKMRSFASNFRGAHLRLNQMITQQKELILNRKMLAQVAVSNPNNLYTISNKIKTIN